MVNTLKYVAVAIAALIFAVGVTAIASPDNLRVTVLDVGQGDAILVEMPHGQRWLIDGGSDQKVIEGLDKILPIFERRLSGVVLTHPHSDHVAGLIHVLRRYEVSHVVMPEVAHTTPEYLAFIKEIKKQNIMATAMKQPFAWNGQSGGVSWRWEFIYPERAFGEEVTDLNETSIVSRLVFGEKRFLFMGDAPKKVESLLMAEGRDLSADVLKVGHHGSSDSSSADFLAAVKSSYAVISAGADNKFGHPALSTLNRLGAVGATVLRTDKNGWVRFESDGESLKISSEH